MVGMSVSSLGTLSALIFRRYQVPVGGAAGSRFPAIRELAELF
jgi:hypothetical protein